MAVKDYILEADAQCAVIGYGSWATAIVSLLVRNQKKVWWYVRNEEVLESLTTRGCNCKYLSEVEFDTEKICPSSNLDEVVSNAKIIIMAAPSAFLKTFLEPLTVSLKDKFIVSAIKGIIPDSYTTVVEYLHDTYGVDADQMGLIAGPTHSEEVGRKNYSFITIVSTKDENSEVIASRLQAPYVKVSYSNDVFGVEYASILKNIYALCVGIVYGLGYGDNFIAAFTAKCASEMDLFLSQAEPQERSIYRTEYLGDLLVTCYSNFSRNRRFGQLIGRGCTVKSALNEMTMVAEGYYAADCIKRVNERLGINMPIAEAVYDILYRRMSARKRINELIKTF